MAEKTEKKPEKEPASPPPTASGQGGKQDSGSGGGMLKSTPVLLGVVMVIEAALLFGAFKMLGGAPRSAHGADLDIPEAHGGHGPATQGGAKAHPGKYAELPVLEFKAPNKRTGRTFLYDVSIYVAVKADVRDKVKAALADREATIKDRIRTIIAQSDPEKLGGGSEPGLETLRRQVKFQIEELIGEGLIEEVLVPRCIPYRAEF